MSALKKQHKDKAGIGSAWNQLIQAPEPPESRAGESKEKSSMPKARHHPALITTNELAYWEVFG